MKTWAEIWARVVPLVQESRSTAEAADRVSELRGVRTNWYSVKKAWHRQVKTGWVGPTQTALASLGTTIPPPRNAIEERLERLETGLWDILAAYSAEDDESIWVVDTVERLEELLGQ